MPLFEEVRLKWNGAEYVIPPDNVLTAIAKIEDVLTLGELANYQGRGRLPLAKLAIAFGAVLRHAGCRVKDEEVYAVMFGNGGQDLQRESYVAVFTLQRMMIPPPSLQAAPGKVEGGVAATPPSELSTSSPSAKDG